jgi:hypothetical protein
MGGIFGPDIDSVSTLTSSQQGVSNDLAARLSALLSPGSAAEEELFRKGTLDPALRTFERVGRPQIASGFARHGATLGSRRGQTLSNALMDVLLGAEQNRTQLQLGAQAQAGQFIGTPMQQLISQPGIGQQLLQLGGTIGAAALSGSGGAGLFSNKGGSQLELPSNTTGRVRFG